MKFGKYAILEPIEHRFKLEPSWYWKIRPPTSREELEIARFLSDAEITLSQDGMRRNTGPTWIEIMHREIALTFGGTNIPSADGGEVLKGAPPIIPDGADVAEIESLLRLMPHDMVLELWDALGEAIPTWGPKKPMTPAASTKS